MLCKEKKTFEYREVKWDSNVQAEIVAWCGGKIGPDGGVWVPCVDIRIYAGTGSFILKQHDHLFMVLSHEEFNRRFEVVA